MDPSDFLVGAHFLSFFVFLFLLQIAVIILILVTFSAFTLLSLFVFSSGFLKNCRVADIRACSEGGDEFLFYFDFSCVVSSVFVLFDV